MGKIFTVTFWKDACERAVSTGAQVIIVGLGLNQTDVLALNADFNTIAMLFVSGFVISVIKALAASQVGDRQSPSFIE